MKYLYSLVTLFLVIFTTAELTFAGIDDSFDWKDKKRKLKIFYDFDTANNKLGDKKLKDIMDEAIQNWNGAKDDTGWEFVSGGTAADHDIRIKFDDNLNRGGGASTTGFPAAGDKNREVSELTITFDPTPEANGTKFEWDQAGKDKDKTKNPISNAKHELSHTIRLDHQGGIRSTTGKIKDPQGAETKGDDVITISKDDKEEAKKASTAAIKVASAGGAPGSGVNLAVAGFPAELPFAVVTADINLVMPDTAFGNNTEVTLSRTSLYSMPNPFSAPPGFDHIMKGVHIDVTGLSGHPQLTDELIKLTIPYEDGTEGEGFLIDIADPDYGSIDELSLLPFFYDPLDQTWKQLDPFALGGNYFLDTTNDFASISIPASFLYSFPNEGDPDTGSLFISLSGRAVVPEPGSLWLFGSGLMGAFAFSRKKKRE